MELHGGNAIERVVLVKKKEEKRGLDRRTRKKL